MHRPHPHYKEQLQVLLEHNDSDFVNLPLVRPRDGEKNYRIVDSIPVHTHWSPPRPTRPPSRLANISSHLPGFPVRSARLSLPFADFKIAGLRSSQPVNMHSLIATCDNTSILPTLPSFICRTYRMYGHFILL